MKTCSICRYFRNDECYANPPVRLPRMFINGDSRTRDERILWGRPKVKGTDVACKDHKLVN